MENCTIYSHQLAFESVVEIIKSKMPKAKVEFNNGGAQKSLVATLKGGFFGKTKVLKINYRERENPSYKLDQVECGLTQNLAGMINMINGIPAENKSLQTKFIQKVKSVNSEMAFMSESTTKDFESVLRVILDKLDAFVFAQANSLFTKGSGQHFVDKNLDLILDGNGRSAVQDISVIVDAKYHDQPKENYTEEQIARKSKSESFLAGSNVKVNQHLPAVEASEDVQIQKLQNVVARAYALLITAVKGEGIEQEHLVKTVESKNIDIFSPKEAWIYEQETLNDQDRAYATWRYESLYVMLWAMGKMDDLKFPSDICDVSAIVGQIFQPSRDDFENSVKLRSKSEILDELDKTYRMHWACVDARIKGQQPTGNINPSVVYERHYSLNWLTNNLGLAWDDVQVNT